MGCSQSAPDAGITYIYEPPTSEEVEKSKQIDKLIRSDEKKMAREVKLLLLGAGESGKTTILKQMKIIHNNGFVQDEMEHYRKQIFDNLCGGIGACLDALEEWELEIESPEAQIYLPMFSKRNSILNDNEPYPADYLPALKAVYGDRALQAAMRRSNEAPIPENLPYFMSEIDRLFQPDYQPTQQDILRARGKTMGITETSFYNKDMVWIHCFEQVTALVFLAAISGYDQCLLEDAESNVMEESIMLFDSICNSKWFVKTSMILFMNKIDLFKEKILISPISNYFPDYAGSNNDYNMARDYFKKRFVSLNKSKDKEVYVHFTTAIDTKMIRVVMAAIQDIIISSNLNEILL